jgi:4-hydroxyphenylpyruvate dioxygenase
VRSGYGGSLSLEVFNDVFRETPNRRIAVDAMRSLLWLEGQVRERLEAAPDEAALRALRSQSLFNPPALPRFAGVSFIEFAVDDAAARALGALLEGMGFRLAGRHRSKAVSLYRQRGINLVVNEQAHAVARARFQAHGPSVCALGLRVDDPLAARNRATALQSARFDAPVGPGEVALPSVVAPGGSIVHFVADGLGDDGLFEKDFILDPQPAGADCGLQHIDHVGMGLAPDRIDTWVLFCRAVLGLEAGDSLKLPDPFGLVRSFGMADAGRRLRFVLNVPLSARTRIAHAVGASGGAGVQQIAFASDDVFASVQRLREAGVALVAVPGNYHDDLATRFDLEPALVQRMREHAVLFDRTADGDYLHAGTRTFADRFFFEIVQRVGGYDGYGTPNASVRMASQVQAGEPSG